jgi:hypothetical protein
MSKPHVNFNQFHGAAPAPAACPHRFRSSAHGMARDCTGLPNAASPLPSAEQYRPRRRRRRPTAAAATAAAVPPPSSHRRRRRRPAAAAAAVPPPPTPTLLPVRASRRQGRSVLFCHNMRTHPLRVSQPRGPHFLRRAESCGSSWAGARAHMDAIWEELVRMGRVLRLRKERALMRMEGKRALEGAKTAALQQIQRALACT